MKLYAIIALLLATVAVAQTPAPKLSVCQPNGKDCVAIAVPKPLELIPYSNISISNISIGAVTYTAKVTATKDFKESVDVDSQTGRVVKLSDEEYERLQKLRQAVADEEKKIAAAHGVLLVPKLIHTGTNTCLAAIYITGLPSCDTDQYQPSDKWQFRGQWLLINVPPSAKEGK